MQVLTNQQMRTLESITVNDYKMPSLILMENAGVGVCAEIQNRFHSDATAVIVCGGGNNGGDGFVVARHLLNQNYGVKVFVIGDPSRIKGDAKINFDILTCLRADINFLMADPDTKGLEEAFDRCDFIVDAILGIGLKSEVNDITEKIILLMNNANRYIVAVDIPSGINGDDGIVMGQAVNADLTVTFDSPKVGNILFPGADHNGELVVKPIGIPAEGYKKIGCNYYIIDEKMILDGVPTRVRNSHKGSYGRAKVIAGSTGMAGAAILTCKAAIRTGLGLLRLYVPDSLNLIVRTSMPEVVTIPLQEMRKGVIGITHIAGIIEDSTKSKVFTIGPGCGATPELGDLIRRAIQMVEIPLVLDADALNVLAKDLHVLGDKKGTIILTPHISEMCRLTGKTIEEVLAHPVYTALDFAKEHDVIVVLKSARTIVATPDGQAYFNINGNSGMATAGSGDVLTGIITGLIAQKVDPLQACVTAVYIHGMTGDFVAKEKGEHGLIAGDLVEKLPYVIKALSEIKEKKNAKQKKWKTNI